MRTISALLVQIACACGIQGTPLLPEDYATTFTEVQPCHRSADHDLRHVRILVDPDALGPFTDRVSPFPPGVFLVKEEYDFVDDTCSELLEWTVMQRRTDATNFGWLWQRLAADRSVVSQDEDGCISCHSQCPGSHESTCAVP
jgi:Cytochrome P460